MKKDYVKVYKRREKIQDLKYSVKSKIDSGMDWVINNKDILVVLVPVIVSGVTTVTKVVVKRVNLRKQENIKNLYCYDRSLGHYWKLRRELTNKEWVEIDKRKRNGERLADILDEFKVLK